MLQNLLSSRNLRVRGAVILGLLGALVLLTSSFTLPASAARLLPVNGFLNADGTLNLAAQPQGTFDLRGWNVTLDSVRGPVLSPQTSALDSVRGPILSPAGSGTNAPNAVGDWSALGSNGAANGSLNGTVNALAVSGGDVYVGGPFTNVNNNGTVLGAADYIAKWDGTNWAALGSNGAGNGSLNSVVYTLAVSGSDLYVGGAFFNVNNNGTPLPEADYIAKWDGTNWSAFGSNGAGNGSLNWVVRELAVSGSDLYVGGLFTDVNNNGTALPEADYIAKWDGTNWSALGSNGAGNGSLNDVVYALAVSGSDLYVGGFFTNVNNNGTALPEADYIAKWDGTNWSALGSNGAGDGSLSNFVMALAVSGSDLYVGGGFFNVNNNGTALPEADYIAKWDGTNWSALGSNGAGDGSLNNWVYALAVSGSDLYVGGQFTDVNNNGTVLTAADRIAKWDGTNWSALGSNGAGDGSLNGDVLALAVSGSNLYVGGLFNNVNNNGTVLGAADFIAKNQISAVTAVNVTNVRAIARDGKNILTWRTTTETQIAGFNVHRRVGKHAWKQINAKFKQAKHAGSALGDKYRFIDRNANAGKMYRYKIQVVYLDGHSEWTQVIRVKGQ